MTNDDYKRGLADEFKKDLERESKPSISSGTACILVKDSSLRNCYGDSSFYYWLREHNFTKWPEGHGYYDGIDWVYVNLNSRMFNPGMPGIPLTTVICNHAVTIDEFKAIYAIFDKYKEKSPLTF